MPVRRPSKNTPASIRPTYMRPAAVLVCVCVCVCVCFEHCKVVTGYVGMTTSFIFHMYQFDRISLSLAITSDLGITYTLYMCTLCIHHYLMERSISRRMSSTQAQFSLSFREHTNNHIRLLRLLYHTCCDRQLASSVDVMTFGNALASYLQYILGTH